MPPSPGLFFGQIDAHSVHATAWQKACGVKRPLFFNAIEQRDGRWHSAPIFNEKVM